MGDPKTSVSADARFKLRLLLAIDTTRMGADPASDRGLVQSVADGIQENLSEMLSTRRSAWLR